MFKILKHCLSFKNSNIFKQVFQIVNIIFFCFKMFAFPSHPQSFIEKTCQIGAKKVSKTISDLQNFVLFLLNLRCFLSKRFLYGQKESKKEGKNKHLFLLFTTLGNEFSSFLISALSSNSPFCCNYSLDFKLPDYPAMGKVLNLCS